MEFLGKMKNKIKLILALTALLLSGMVSAIPKPIDSVNYYQAKINKTTNQEVLANINTQFANYYRNNNNVDKAFLQYKKALSVYEKINAPNELAKLHYSMFIMLEAQHHSDIDPLPYLKKFENYAIKYQDTLKLINVKSTYANINFTADKYPIAKKTFRGQ